MVKIALFSLGMALLVASAAAQGCPSTICNSYFANAMGGPVDCCNYEYTSTNNKCVWGGSPVSFKQTRVCSDGKSNYKVLVQNNFQGPPSAAECRCQNPSGGATSQSFSPIQMSVQLKPKSGQDIKGADIGCDGQSFCKVCGGLDNVKNACAGRPKCVAFSFDPASNCGYLKTAATLQARSGWVAYVRE